MKKIYLTLCGLMMVAPMAAFAAAGTCDDPEILASVSNVSGSTCGGEVGINMGGAVYGHPSKVYKFHINHAGPGGTPTTITIGGTNREASVTSSCSVAPVAAGAGTLAIDANALTDGDWLLVVSTDPGLPVTDPPTCGDFSVEAGVLPVSLQTFTVQ